MPLFGGSLTRVHEDAARDPPDTFRLDGPADVVVGEADVDERGAMDETVGVGGECLHDELDAPRSLPVPPFAA